LFFMNMFTYNNHMLLNALQGVVRRRILVNFKVDPAVIRRHVPAPFELQLVDGWSIAGICLIRLEHMRPPRLPEAVGIASDNAAHRIAVTWPDRAGRTCTGVFIPRRDTASPLNALVGGRLFPGEHQRARFLVQDDGDTIDLAMRTADGRGDVRLRAHAADRLPGTSVFPSMAAASEFFAAGSAGYSATAAAGLHGLELRTLAWRLEPLAVELVRSSYFAYFPEGSVAFESALLMRDIPHEWHALPSLTPAAAQAPLLFGRTGQ